MVARHVDEVVTDRRAERRAEKRAAIVAEAWSIARRDGLGALSLHGLAAAVGLRQPSLYVYFDSKLALYDALFADGYRQLLDYVGERDYTGNPRDALVRFLRDQVAWSGADFVRYQLLFQRSIPGFEPSPESWALALEFYGFAQRVLGAAGLTGKAEVDLFSALVSGMSSQQAANDPGGTRWAKHAEIAVDMFLASAKRRTTTRSGGKK
jgi:AcrR family transcriptional regulator